MAGMNRQIPKSELHSDAAIITALGGPKSVGLMCSVTQQHVIQAWKRTGIPPAYRFLLHRAFPGAFPGEPKLTRARSEATASALKSIHPKAFERFDATRSHRKAA